MKFKETNFYNWHNTIDVQLHVHTCVIILCVYIYGISRHKNFVARKKMRFPFVVHSQGKWRKNRRKTGVCETVAKISWHVPIFMKVSAGVTRDSSLSSRSSFRNVPRLTFFLSPSPRRYFLQPSLLRGCLSKETRRQLRSPVTEKSAFSEADSKQSSSIAFCVFDVPFLLLLLLLLLFLPSAQN